MKTFTKALGKTGVATAVAGAMAVSSASPAAARDHKDGIDAGDVIAGALIIGGIAAIASAVDKDDRHYRDRRYRDRRDVRRGGSRRAVERCVRAAERDARRYGYNYADVTQIRDVERTRYGWRVKGRIVVDGARGYRGNRGNYGYRNGDRYRGDYHRSGYGRGHNRGYDKGRFTCRIERGRVNYVDFKNIRGL